MVIMLAFNLDWKLALKTAPDQTVTKWRKATVLVCYQNTDCLLLIKHTHIITYTHTHTRTHTHVHTHTHTRTHTHTHTHTHLTAWAISKSAHRSRQITTPAPHHSVFYRPDALPAAQPNQQRQNTEGKHNYVQFLINIHQNFDCINKQKGKCSLLT